MPATDGMSDVEVLARTLYGEARGEPVNGKQAVASVILNRAANPRWWGRSVRDVCLKPRQFSCWNADDPMRPKLLAVRRGDPRLEECWVVAEEAMAGRLPDNSGGADHYVNLSVASPAWARRDRITTRVGAHTFYRLEIPARALDAAPIAQTKTVQAAGAVAGTAAGGIAVVQVATDMASQLGPVFSVIRDYGPWAVAILVVAVAGFFIWNRVKHRKETGE